MTDTRVPVRRRSLAALALGGALLALTGCSNSGGGGGSGSGASSAPPSATTSGAAGAASRIVIKNFAFSPASLTVRPGATVTVVNQDTTAHTVTSDGSKSFDTGTVGPGRSATFTAPKTAGAYPYICDIHQYMKGTLTVG
jgi:plastocyanin